MRIRNQSDKEYYDTRRDEMKRMFDDGYTLREIGYKFYLTRQRVAQIVGKRTVARFRAFTSETCKYDGLREWLNANCISIRHLSTLLGYERSASNFTNMSKKLKKLVRFNTHDIEKIIDLSGKEYKELFVNEK